MGFDLQKISFAPNAKSVMTSFDIQAIVSELKGKIVGSRIDNIYQFSPLSFLISLRPSERMIMESGRRVHLTRYEVEKPATPSLFCSILRRNLGQSCIEDIEVKDFERVVKFKLSSKDGAKSLVLEIFGAGNVLLLNEEERIVQALTYRRMRDRNVVRGEVYRLPPPRGISPALISLADFSSIKMQKGDVARALGRILSIGSPYIEEILLRARIEKSLMAMNLTDIDIESLYSASKSLVQDLDRISSCVVTEASGEWLDIVPFRLVQYSSKKNMEYQTCNEAADDYFTALSAATQITMKAAVTDSRFEERKRIIEQQKEHLKNLEAEGSKNRRIADLLYIHFQEVNELLESLLQHRERLEVALKVLSLDSEKRRVRVQLEEQEFDLDLRLSFNDNARQFYDYSKNARGKLQGVVKAIDEAEKRFNKQDQERPQEAEHPLRIVRERAWYEKFRWARSRNGAFIVGGRDATTNEILIKKNMEPSDLVFHADFPGAPFVLLKASDIEISEGDIDDAAHLAASYSSAWQSGATFADVYWVKPEQISKEAPSGEYLTRGSFMIRGQKNFLRHIQLRISIGLLEEPEGLQVIGGPPEATKKHTGLAVDIIPGRLTSGALAKDIRKALASKRLELRKSIIALPIEEIQRFIPAGRGEIENES